MASPADNAFGPDVKIHPTAEVEPGAHVGEGTTIWGWTHVRSGGSIGKHCMIAERCFIDTGAIIEDCCRIQNGVSVYNGVWLKHHVFVGPEVTFTNDMFSAPWPEGEEHPPWSFGCTTVGPYTRIGANCTILANITIGSHCTIGAGAIVLADVPDNTTVVGTWKGKYHWLRKLLRFLWPRRRKQAHDVIVPLSVRNVD